MPNYRTQAIGGLVGVIPSLLASSYLSGKAALHMRDDYPEVRESLNTLKSLRKDISSLKAHAGDVITSDEIYNYYKGLPDQTKSKMTIDDYERLAVDLMKHKLAPVGQKLSAENSIIKDLGIGAAKGSALGAGIGAVYGGVTVAGDKYKNYIASENKRLNDVLNGYKKIVQGKPDKLSLYASVNKCDSVSEPLKNPAKLFPGISGPARILASEYFKKHGVTPGKLTIDDYYSALKGIDRYLNRNVDELDSIHPLALINEQRDVDSGQRNLLQKAEDLSSKVRVDEDTVAHNLARIEGIVEDRLAGKR